MQTRFVKTYYYYSYYYLTLDMSSNCTMPVDMTASVKEKVEALAEAWRTTNTAVAGNLVNISYTYALCICYLYCICNTIFNIKFLSSLLPVFFFFLFGVYFVLFHCL